MASAASSISASATRMSTRPVSGMNGSRSAESRGGTIAFSTAIARGGGQRAAEVVHRRAGHDLRCDEQRAAEIEPRDREVRSGLSFGRLGLQARRFGDVLFGGSHSWMLDPDSFAGPCAGPHPKRVMNLAAAGCSIGALSGLTWLGHSSVLIERRRHAPRDRSCLTAPGLAPSPQGRGRPGSPARSTGSSSPTPTSTISTSRSLDRSGPVAAGRRPDRRRRAPAAAGLRARARGRRPERCSSSGSGRSERRTQSTSRGAGRSPAASAALGYVVEGSRRRLLRRRHRPLRRHGRARPS